MVASFLFSGFVVLNLLNRSNAATDNTSANTVDSSVDSTALMLNSSYSPLVTTLVPMALECYGVVALVNVQLVQFNCSSFPPSEMQCGNDSFGNAQVSLGMVSTSSQSCSKGGCTTTYYCYSICATPYSPQGNCTWQPFNYNPTLPPTPVNNAPPS